MFTKFNLNLYQIRTQDDFTGKHLIPNYIDKPVQIQGTYYPRHNHMYYFTTYPFGLLRTIKHNNTSIINTQPNFILPIYKQSFKKKVKKKKKNNDYITSSWFSF